MIDDVKRLFPSNYSGWAPILIKFAFNYLKDGMSKKELIADVGAGPEAVISSAILHVFRKKGNFKILAIEPNYPISLESIKKINSNSKVIVKKGKLKDLEPKIIDIAFFNPPVLPEHLILKSDYRAYLYIGGKNSWDALEDVIDSAKRVLKPEGSLFVIWPSHFPPPLILKPNLLHDYEEVTNIGCEIVMIENFLKKAPLINNNQGNYNAWMMSEIKKWASNWAEIGINTSESKLTLSVFALRNK